MSGDKNRKPRKPKPRKKAPEKTAPKDKLDSIYHGLINRLEKIENFTIEQAPDVCKEIVATKVVSCQNKAINGGVFLSFGIIMLIIAGFGIQHGLAAERDAFTGFGVMGVFFGLILMGGNLEIIIRNLLDIREINAGKKLTVLKGLSGLLK